MMTPLGALSFLALLVAFILHTTAFSSSYWIESDGTDTPVPGAFHLGLWTTCYLTVPPTVLPQQQQQQLQNFDNLTETTNTTAAAAPTATTKTSTTTTTTTMKQVTYSWMCNDTHQWMDNIAEGYDNAWIDGFQAMATVAFITCFVSTCCAFVYWCSFSSVGHDVSLCLVFGATLATFATACFSLIAVIICGAKPQQDSTIVFRADLSWCFYLELVATILVWSSCGTTFAEYAITLVAHHPAAD